MRKLRRKRNKRKVHVVLGVAICLLTFMTVGYAAFSTNITLNAKGRILNPDPTAVDTITVLADVDNTIVDDETADHNLRYSGAEVNNYVCIQPELDNSCLEANLYRIIGVFNNIKTATTDYEGETRIKIIKATNNGSDYWDTTGSNNWALAASLNTTLQALPVAVSDLIDDAVWNLGGNNSNEVTAEQAYTFERGITGGAASPTTTTWTGKIGLMYPSDYGYASSGCRDGSKLLHEYNDNACKNSNWLYLGNDVNEWLLSPHSVTNSSVFYIFNTGIVDSDSVSSNSFAVRPVMFLKSNVGIVDNDRDGSSSSPYLLELKEAS